MRQGATFALVPMLCLAIVGGSGRAGDGDGTVAGSWSLPDESRGSRVAPLFLLSRPEVREDLKIPAGQFDEIDRAIADLFAKAAALRGKKGQAAIEARKAVDEGEKDWLEKHLTPDQVDRLWQIDLLWEGPAAMATRPAIAEDLALSDEQKAALHAALRERDARKAKTKDVAAANHEFGARALTILSDGQKQRWARMVGRSIAHKPATATASAPPARVDR
jgi:hypothetical protein